jgi:tRNA (mo5U34)-methyltransferase
MNIAQRRLQPVSDRALRESIESLAPWFHNMNLRGIWTAPDHFLGDYPGEKFASFEPHLPDELAGKSVLDIGCNAGFYSIEMKRRGADRVLGIDSDDRYLAQARLACEILGYEDVEFRKLDVYDVAALAERFDVVLFMGVLYHLRHPLLALDLIYEHVADDLLIFQSMQRGSKLLMEIEEDYDFNEAGHFFESAYPKLHFIEQKYAGDWTNWWVPNRACAEAMLRSAGFRIETRAEEEVYICRRAERRFEGWGDGGGAVYPAGGQRA